MTLNYLNVHKNRIAHWKLLQDSLFLNKYSCMQSFSLTICSMKRCECSSVDHKVCSCWIHHTIQVKKTIKFSDEKFTTVYITLESKNPASEMHMINLARSTTLTLRCETFTSTPCLTGQQTTRYFSAVIFLHFTIQRINLLWTPTSFTIVKSKFI